MKTNLATIKETGMELKFIKPITKDAIPPKPQNRHSILQKLPIWKELLQVCEATRAGDIAPFEQAAEIDLTPFKKELGELKHPVETVLARIKDLLRSYKVANRLEIIKRGEKLYLVGQR